MGLVRKIILAIAIMAGISMEGYSQDDESLMVMFWNMENFFDYIDDGSGESDKEFSAKGVRHWTKRKFNAKCQAIAKSILWISSTEGRLPDIIGMAEIENIRVLKKLIESTALGKLDYGIVHYDSPDHRGIDVALLYRKDILTLTGSKACRVNGISDSNPADSLKTRDILLAQFYSAEVLSGARINILVNHHPSKFGGQSSEWKRNAAIGRLKQLTDSLYACGERCIIATGDFNDTPENPLFERLGSILANKALPLAQKGSGTIRYNGKWELIDMFFVSKPLEKSEMKIITLPFLMKWDNVHPGQKPLRTYSGPKYLGGVSDHLPIVLIIRQTPTGI